MVEESAVPDNLPSGSLKYSEFMRSFQHVAANRVITKNPEQQTARKANYYILKTP